MIPKEHDKSNGRFIAVFDSGIGGLSVLRQLQELLPCEQFIYFADQAHIPYGEHTLEEIRSFSEAIARFLIEQGAKLIVVACNTASAAALTQLRSCYPQLPFVGMEPAVKPAAQKTRTKTIGVLATQSTFMSARYAALMGAYGANINVIEDPCLGLVSLIEAGDLQSASVSQRLHSIIAPMLEKNVDTLVLGCTHYPLVERQIRQIAGEGVHIIDPAPAVAQQTKRVLFRYQLQNDQKRQDTVVCLTTGNAAPFANQLAAMGWEQTAVRTAVWENDRLVIKNQV